jgi:hypothetical protein
MVMGKRYAESLKAMNDLFPSNVRIRPYKADKQNNQ